MRVDLKSLGAFNRIGSDGAANAADALSTLTGRKAFVETTAIHFSRVPDVATLLGDGHTRVVIAFEGALDGRALLAFDSDGGQYVLDNLEGTVPEQQTDPLYEVANIVTSSFVDGWAANLTDTIDISMPESLNEDEGLIPSSGDVVDSTFVFRSSIEFEAPGHGCEFYLVPDLSSFLETLREQIGRKPELEVGLEELTAFLRLTVAGAETVADQLETMTGMETTVQVSHLDVVPVESVPNSLSTSAYLGTVFRFEGPMDGYLAVLFEESSADEVVRAMAPEAQDTEALRRSAIEELGNITASGFIDGWANALGTTIDHSVPDFVEDMGRAVLQAVAVRLGRTQDVAYAFDVTVTADEPLQCRVFAFPEEAGLTRVIASLDGDIDVTSVERL